MPVHGEWRHLVANADLAAQTGIPRRNIVLAEATGNGVTDSYQLEQVMRRALGSWVGGKIRRRPMIIPVVLQA
jgi:mRNA degradation ribonuclease J1/J2